MVTIRTLYNQIKKAKECNLLNLEHANLVCKALNLKNSTNYNLISNRRDLRTGKNHEEDLLSIIMTQSTGLKMSINNTSPSFKKEDNCLN